MYFEGCFNFYQTSERCIQLHADAFKNKTFTIFHEEARGEARGPETIRQGQSYTTKRCYRTLALESTRIYVQVVRKWGVESKLRRGFAQNAVTRKRNNTL